MGIREWPRSAEGNLLPLPGAAQLNDKNSESTIPQIVMKGTAVLKSMNKLSKEGKKDGAETGKTLDKTARNAIAQMLCKSSICKIFHFIVPLFERGTGWGFYSRKIPSTPF